MIPTLKRLPSCSSEKDPKEEDSFSDLLESVQNAFGGEQSGDGFSVVRCACANIYIYIYFKLLSSLIS